MRRLLAVLFGVLLIVGVGASSADASDRQVVYQVMYANGTTTVKGATPAITSDLFYATWNKFVTVYDATPKDGTNRWAVGSGVTKWQAGQVPWASGGSASIISVREGTLSGNVVGQARMVFSGGVMIDCDITLHPGYSGSSMGHHILLHELGHCAGWKHVNRSTSIMYASVGPGSYLLDIDKWTLRQTRRVY